MNHLADKNYLKECLERYKLYPRKSQGQNFLVDKKALEIICASAKITKKDTVLEIGPGTGTLTFELCKKAKKVIAVEKDKKLIPLLSDNLSDFNNLQLVNKDILRFPAPEKPYKVVANIPYYITSPVLRKFLENGPAPALMILTVQKEVAERITARPPKMNMLAVAVRFCGEAEIIRHIPPQSFWPSPKVSSSVLKITPFKKYDKKIQKEFFALLRAGYAHPRKQLIANLSRLDKRAIKGIELKSRPNIEKAMEKAGISPQKRAEELGVKEWVDLTKALQCFKK